MNEHLVKNNVKIITIAKDRRAEAFSHRAEIEGNDGNKYFITLGSVDNFLAKLDYVQREMGRNP